MKDLTDEELMLLFKGGNNNAFDVLFDTYQSKSPFVLIVATSIQNSFLPLPGDFQIFCVNVPRMNQPLPALHTKQPAEHILRLAFRTDFHFLLFNRSGIFI